jgi:hypothetical protein
MYNLIGVDGNAYAIMGYVAKAMRNEGYSQEEINAYFDDAKSSDYSHLVSVSGEKIREINRKLREN